MWLVVAASKTAGKTYSGNLYRTTGPPFNSVPFPPIGSKGGATGRVVGTTRFEFWDGETVLFAYSVDDATRTKLITREVIVAPGTVCRRWAHRQVSRNDTGLEMETPREVYRGASLLTAK